ncbi:MAG: PIN domain-containing protein [Acidobacteriota bacterium]
MRAFLDANVLFSSAIGGASFELLWELAATARIELVTSSYCLVEATTNLKRKAPEALARLEPKLRWVAMVAEAPEYAEWAMVLVEEKEAAVLASARGAKADALVTGDLKHFGALMKRDDLPLKVMTVRELLLRGPGVPR